MRKVPRSLLAVVALGLIAVALRVTVFKPEILRVEVARVDRGPVEETVTNTRAGTVKARTRARLSPQIGGRVAALPFRKGARVEAGALLLKLDDAVQQAQVRLAGEDVRTARARVNEACLAADLAVREWERGKALVADGITSEQALDVLESGRDRARAGCEALRATLGQAEAGLGLAQAQLALTEVRAPFSGVLADSSTEVGEWITPAPPGVPIPPVLDLLDPSSIYVSGPIDEVDAERVKVGQEVRLTIDSRPGESFPGRLVRVAPFVLDVLEQNRTVEVEAEFADPAVTAAVFPGTSADVEIVLSRRDDTLRVPASAVGEGGKVLVLADGVLSERTVETGLRNWRSVEVREGLRDGEFVVTARTSTAIKAGARAEAK